jgi:superfamily II DNA or RNA helicase
MIIGPGPEELIAGGYLVKTRIFSPPLVDTSGLHVRMGDFKNDEAEALVDTPAITGDAYSHYKKHADGMQGLAFCTSVKHAENVAERFRKEGVAAVSLNGGTDKQVRRMAFADYRQGKIRILTAADIFSEGVDCPGARVGIMLRPTQSLTLYRQQKGRLLRPDTGKDYAVLLDCVQNAIRPGFELAPGEKDDWQLEMDAAKRKKKQAPGIRVCPKCFAASAARATACVECGHIFEVKARQNVEERDGELVELTAEQIAKKRERREQGRAATLEQLTAIARIKGYNENWVRHVYEGRLAKQRKKA